jgi:hypothetical protein
MFEIDVTEFLAGHRLKYFSGSIAELGNDAGQQTWAECNDKAEDWQPLDTDEKRETFRDFVLSSGGWSEEEIAEWPDSHLQALCIQWIAGDARECGIDGEDLSAIDWSQLEQDQHDGQAPGSLYRGDDGRVYWLCSEC